ncbi:MAG: glycosyltransferase [Deltaproteobacteria bacterium]|jgi:predicted glycosyltransferase|nr:glycosyltransferase [Deltaproteobacteria bacterium]
MARNSTYNILMYSHDTYGLGHIRRTMAIAAHLLGPRVNILILTGSPIAGRFSFPEQIDFVRIPGMIKKTNDEYLPLSIKINARHALDIRKNIITATAKTFQPQLFIVDKEPLGLRKEVLPTLKWLQRSRPATRAILGLRDIMDDAATVKKDWQDKGVYEILQNLYSEIWVYGNREFYDPITEYDIADSISQKMYFTGYIPRKTPGPEAVRNIRKELGVKAEEKLVVVTTGGGGDGYLVMRNYVNMLESAAKPLPFKSVLITGPFMPKNKRRKIFKRARKLGVRGYHFYRQMEKIFAAGDLVVCMGGYNTLCEILNQGTPSLVIPRETPRKEQLIRAQAFKRHNLVDYIPWAELEPTFLLNKILAFLGNSAPYVKAISQFRFTGIETMQQRIHDFRSKRS